MSMRNNQTNRLQNSCTNAKFGRRFGNDSQTVAAIAARRRVRASRGITIAVAPVRRASVGRPSLERLPCVFRGPRGITDPPHPWRERRPTVARAFAMRLPCVCRGPRARAVKKHRAGSELETRTLDYSRGAKAPRKLLAVLHPSHHKQRSFTAPLSCCSALQFSAA